VYRVPADSPLVGLRGQYDVRVRAGSKLGAGSFLGFYRCGAPAFTCALAAAVSGKLALHKAVLQSNWRQKCPPSSSLHFMAFPRGVARFRHEHYHATKRPYPGWLKQTDDETRLDGAASRCRFYSFFMCLGKLPQAVSRVLLHGSRTDLLLLQAAAVEVGSGELRR
jgi:hypothetical protein